MATDIVPALGHGLVTTQAGVTTGFDAIDDRRFWSVGLLEGIIDAGSYRVAQRAAGANMSVDIAASTGLGALIQGDAVAAQGLYYVAPHTAVINEVIAASDVTNPRIDTVILEALDTTHGGTADRARTRVVTGTPTAGATLANLSGAGAVPSSALLLAYVLVPAAATTVTSANIGALKSPWDVAAGAVAGAPPVYALGRPSAYVPAARATLTASLGLGAAASGAVSLTTEDFDTDGIHDNVTNPSRFTIQTPGMYRTLGALRATGAGLVQVFVGRNGSNLAETRVGFTVAGVGATTAALLRLSFGDYVELRYYNDVANTFDFAQFSVDWAGRG